MPQFKEVTTNKLELPSTADEENPDDRAYVIVKDRVQFGDTIDMLSSINQYEQRINLLKSFIVDWNYTDEQGVKLPLTTDNIAKLEASDAKYIVEIATDKIVTAKAEGGMDKDEKKASSSTSTPSPQVEI